jgi:hypothetical protein
MWRAVVDPLLGSTARGGAAVRRCGCVTDAALLSSSRDPATTLAFEVWAATLGNQALLRGWLLRAAKLQRIEPGDVFVGPAGRLEGKHVSDPARHVHLGGGVRAAEDRGVAR